MTDHEKAVALLAKADELIKQGLQKLQEAKDIQARADALAAEAKRLLKV